MIVGLLSGFVGAIVGSIIGVIVGGAGLSTLAASQAADAEELLGTSAVSFLTAGAMSGVSLCFNLFLYPVFGALGGAIGGVVFARSPTAVK